MKRSDNYQVKKKYAAQSVVIGIIDGLTVPFAVAAGLTALSKSSLVIFSVCFTLAVAYSLTMGISAYISGKKYEPAENNFSSALIICFSYIAGGFIAVVSFLF
ncbi:MAG: VIT1/CCC1 transporter family protein, partial [Flavitalea sp.]